MRRVTQQAEGLVGVAAGEAVEAEVLQAGRAGRSRPAACRGGGRRLTSACSVEPVLHVAGQGGPGRRGRRGARRRGARAASRWRAWCRRRRRPWGSREALAGDLDGHLAQRLVADGLAAEEEGVAGGEGGGEVLLDLAERRAAAALEAHLEQSRCRRWCRRSCGWRGRGAGRGAASGRPGGRRRCQRS